MSIQRGSDGEFVRFWIDDFVRADSAEWGTSDPGWRTDQFADFSSTVTFLTNNENHVFLPTGEHYFVVDEAWGADSSQPDTSREYFLDLIRKIDGVLPARER